MIWENIGNDIRKGEVEIAGLSGAGFFAWDLNTWEIVSTWTYEHPKLNTKIERKMR